MDGSLGNFYESVKNLDDVYLQPNSEETLLKPTPPGATGLVIQGLIMGLGAAILAEAVVHM